MWKIAYRKQAHKKFENLEINLKTLISERMQNICDWLNDKEILQADMIPLKGKWKGHRSSRLNRQYRVLYRVESERILVEVVSIAAHDYRKK